MQIGEAVVVDVVEDVEVVVSPGCVVVVVVEIVVVEAVVVVVDPATVVVVTVYSHPPLVQALAYV